MINSKRYIAFSLWGDSDIYTIGAIRNAELARMIYPGWEVLVYYNDSVPVKIIEQLKHLGVNVIDMSDSGIYPLFWRFLAADLADASHVVFRDTDSRLSVREKAAVDEWIEAGCVLHVMRDHPYHQVPFGAGKSAILGGMWGIKAGMIDMKQSIAQFISSHADAYGLDQTFLVDIYDQFSDSKIVHDEFFDGRPFPIKRKDYRFVGERIDINEMPLGDDWKQIAEHCRKSKSIFNRITNLIRKIR